MSHRSRLAPTPPTPSEEAEAKDSDRYRSMAAPNSPGPGGRTTGGVLGVLGAVLFPPPPTARYGCGVDGSSLLSASRPNVVLSRLLLE